MFIIVVRCHVCIASSETTTWIDKLKPYRRIRLNKENCYLSNIIEIWKRNGKQISTMCFAIRMRIINSPCLSVVVFLCIIYVSVYMILGMTRDKHATIFTENFNNKLIYSLNNEKKETVLPTKNFENLNMPYRQFPLKVSQPNQEKKDLNNTKMIFFWVLIGSKFVWILIFCFVCRLYFCFRPRIEDEDVDVRNMPVRFQNNRVVLGLGNEYSSDDEV